MPQSSEPTNSPCRRFFGSSAAGFDGSAAGVVVERAFGLGLLPLVALFNQFVMPDMVVVVCTVVAIAREQ